MFEAKLAAVIDLLKSTNAWSPENGGLSLIQHQLGLDELWQSFTELKKKSHDEMQRCGRGRDRSAGEGFKAGSTTRGTEPVGIDESSPSAASTRRVTRATTAQMMEVANPDVCVVENQPLRAGNEHFTPASPRHSASPVLTLTTAQMGDKMVGNLRAYIECPGFSGKISLSDLGQPDWGIVSREVKDPIKHCINYSHLGVQFCPERKTGATKLFTSLKSNFRFPHFSGLPAEASCDYLDNTISSPPLTPLTYYVGPPLAPADFNNLLHPGRLDTLGNIPGVNSIYWHAGEAGSGTAFHCEDASFRSCNLTLYGFKDWILIRKGHDARFEEFVSRLYPSARKTGCSQWLRHLNVLFTPERLCAEGIAFDMIRAGPGDLVFTAPGQYHAVLNSTACFAIAINFVLPDEQALGPTAVCSECGLFNLQNDLIKHPDKRKAPMPGHRKHPIGRASPTHTSHGSYQKRQKTACMSGHEDVKRSPRLGQRPRAQLSSDNDLASTDLDWQPMEDASATEWQDHIISHDPFCKAPEVTVSDTLVLRILLALRGHPGIKALVDVVQCWRNQEMTEIDLLRNMRRPGSHCRDIAGFLTQLGLRGSLRQVLEFHAKIEFSKMVDETFGDQGRLNVSDWVKVHDQMGWPGKPDEAAQRCYREWRKVGRRLGLLPRGLLCLLPSEPAYPSLIKLADLLRLDSASVASLRASLESDPYTRHLLDVGRKLIDAIWDGRDIPECKWEGTTSASICESRMEQGLDRIAFYDLAECTYDPGKFVNTPAPDGWHGEWPTNPMVGDGCWECNEPGCCCHENLSSARIPRNLRIRSGGSKWHGIFVQAPAGKVAFKRHDILGELTGELEPPGTFNMASRCEMVFDVEREDLAATGVVCQIYSGNQGNWTRKVKHFCRDPSAYFEGRLLSGKYRILLRAMRDLVNGEEVTVGHKKDAQHPNCSCDSCHRT